MLCTEDARSMAFDYIWDEDRKLYVCTECKQEVKREGGMGICEGVDDFELDIRTEGE